jgi:putative membrane protein
MNQPSVFQTQYPLSSRKFWKKIFEKSLLFLFIILLFTAIAIIPILVSMNSGSEANMFGSFVTIGAGVLFAFVLLIIIPYSLYVKAYIKRYYYDCGEQFITIKKGVFAPTEIHVQYQKIQDVYVDQDIIDRIMGLYDVHIASATVTSGIEAHIDGVNADVAEALKNIILGKIHGASNYSNPTQAPMSQPQQAQVSPVQFSQKISSETYPINGKWVWSAIFGAIVFSLFLTLIFSSFFIRVTEGLGLNSIFLLVVVFGILFFINMIFKSIWKSNFYFEFMPDYILLRTGVISRSENHLPYKSIQNVLNNQTILDRMFGLSTVTIQNAAQQMVSSRGQSIGQGSAIALVWQPKDKADELSQILNDIVSKINPQNSSNMMGL